MTQIYPDDRSAGEVNSGPSSTRLAWDKEPYAIRRLAMVAVLLPSPMHRKSDGTALREDSQCRL